MLKIAFFDTKPYDKVSFEAYNSQLEFVFYETKLNKNTARLAKGCDVVCIFVNDSANAEIIDILLKYGIKAIALRCAGYNNVDIKYAKGKIAVFHVPAYSPHAVAEHTMAMLLTLVRKTHKAFIRTRDHNFSLAGLTGFDLYGKTVGIIGTGRIGTVFAEICKGFGMKILAYDKFPNSNNNLEYTDISRLFKESHIISLHCPLNDETRHIINEKAISQMQQNVYIINTSRGALVDTKALIQGLKSKQIGGACLDVYEEESEVFFEDMSENIMNDDDLARLISMPNVLVTSHQAFLTNEALNNIAQTTVINILDFFEKGRSDNDLTKE